MRDAETHGTILINRSHRPARGRHSIDAFDAGCLSGMLSLAVSPLFSSGAQPRPPLLRDAGTMGEPLHLSPFFTESIGSGAAILTTVAFFPQVLRTWRKGGEDGLSWAMLLLYLAGLGLWFAYGVLLTSMPLMLANGITGMLVLLILGLKAWRATQRARLRATGLAEDSPR